MPFPDGSHEVRPLRINKQLQEDEPKPTVRRDRIGATIGSKTSSMRSFWSDMEKNSDTSPPTPFKSSPSAAATNPNRNSRVFENNIFVQTDKSPPESKSPPDLEAVKSSIVRNGSLSRLQGPRQFSSSQSSPSKLKKMVTFNNSAQVIQYESVTPDLSGQSDEEEEEGSLDVPIIDPTPVRVASRPLPVLPMGDAIDQEESTEESAQEEDEEGDSGEEPLSLTDPRPLPSEEDMQDLRAPSLVRQHSLLDSERKVQTEYITHSDSIPPVRSMSQRRKSIDNALGHHSLQSAFDFEPLPRDDSMDLPVREPNHYDSDAESYESPEPESLDVSIDEPEIKPEPVEQPSTPVLEKSLPALPNLDEPIENQAEWVAQGDDDDQEESEDDQVGPPIEVPVEAPVVEAPRDEDWEDENSESGTIRAQSPEEQDRELQEQLDQLDLGDLDYNADEPLGAVDDADEDEDEDGDNLERSGTVIHRPSKRKISPYLYYEQPEEAAATQWSYRGAMASPSPPPEQQSHRHATPPSIPVPRPPLRQPTPPMPELLPEPVREPSLELAATVAEEEENDVPFIKKEPVDEQFTGLPEFEQTTPLIDQSFEPQAEPEPVHIKQEPVDLRPVKQEFIEEPAQQYSPVPSLERGHTPNSMDSPIKTERESSPNEWAQVYQSSDLNMPSISDFASEFSSFDQEHDLSLPYPSNTKIKQEYQQQQPLGEDIEGFESDPEEEEEENEVQEPQTIRASSSRLKTRPSLTPMDVRRISNTRRASSGGKKREEELAKHDQHIMQELNRVPVPMLQLTYDQAEADSMFGDLDQEFDKLLNNQKRGYTLRENDSMVIATERRASEDHQYRKISGPVKQVYEPTIEEEEGRPPVPPKDGAAVNTAGAASTKEHDMPNGDKGRLFVRVVSIKDIDLPGVDEKRAKFSLTLDNGIHCITTQYNPLHKTAFLDQEFELTVGDELEFILTVKTKYPKPQARRPIASAAAAPPPPTPQPTQRPEKRHGLAKLFGSPKKKQPVSTAPPQPPQLQPAPMLPPKDAWDSLVANDGSFGRSYVAFSQYQNEVYGRPATFEIPCFNEWAKRGNNASGKKQPYKIGKMQVQMMYVPRASKREVLPKNIKEALEELREARKHEPMVMEGCLSQLGGDCRYWRRRLFKLEGTMLTAFSESSGKPRATINLAKAVRVIDDKGSLTQPVVQVGKNRRKSAFAEQEEGFMFVNEGFRIRFKNNEIIDFYADSADIKQQWIHTLIKTIGSAPSQSPWTDLVMKRVAAEE